MCVRKKGIYILPPTRETRTTMTTERHRSNGDRGRADGRLRSSNSRNETPKQFRVIGKSGRCFRAIPWLVTAYHRVARQPTALPTRGLVSSYRGFQEGSPASLSPFVSLSLSHSRALFTIVDLFVTLPRPPASHSRSPSLRSPTLRPRRRRWWQRGRRLNSSSRGTIDNGSDHSFPVYSIRII